MSKRERIYHWTVLLVTYAIIGAGLAMLAHNH